MACFLVPAAEAVVVTIAAKVKENSEVEVATAETTEATEISKEEAPAIPWSRRLKWLTYMLWGGAILLAFEHIWHGEVVPWFPFLTAMSDPGDMSEMFHEMATVGVCMAALITLVWIVMCIVANYIVKRPAKGNTQKAAS